MAGAVIIANAAVVPRSLYIAIGMLLVKVSQEATPPLWVHSELRAVTHA
jgi:hypothetical protein